MLFPFLVPIPAKSDALLSIYGLSKMFHELYDMAIAARVLSGSDIVEESVESRRLQHVEKARQNPVVVAMMQTHVPLIKAALIRDATAGKFESVYAFIRNREAISFKEYKEFPETVKQIIELWHDDEPHWRLDYVIRHESLPEFGVEFTFLPEFSNGYVLK